MRAAVDSKLLMATAELRPGQGEDADHRRFPRIDYIELSRFLDIEIIDYDIYKKLPGRWFKLPETRLRSDLYMAFRGLIKSRKSTLVIAMSERVGIPYGGLHRFIPGRSPFVMMLTCWSPRQEWAFSKLKLVDSADLIIVMCQSLKDKLIQLGADPNRVKVIHYGIDHCFFIPIPDMQAQHGSILSIGESRTRDYGLLIDAVKDMPVDLKVAASGTWYSREKNPGVFDSLPSNVSLLRHIPSNELRTLYARSQFVVLPVIPSVASFGATSYLEASSMARPVIATRSPGLEDYLIDGVTGIFVEPGDVEGMRSAIRYFIDYPEEAERMGKRARLRVEQCLNIDRYARELAAQFSAFPLAEMV